MNRDRLLLYVGIPFLYMLVNTSDELILAQFQGSTVPPSKFVWEWLSGFLIVGSFPVIHRLAKIVSSRNSHRSIRFLLHLFFSFLFAFTHLFLTLYCLNVLFDSGNRQFSLKGWNFFPKFLFRFCWRVALYFIVLAVSVALENLERRNRKRLEISELEFKLAKANLQRLRTHLDSDFLFSSLRVLPALVSKRITDARKFIAVFSMYMRKLLVGRHTVTVKSEIDILTAFLELEQIRNGYPMIYDLSVEPGAVNKRIDDFLLHKAIQILVQEPFCLRSFKISIRAGMEQEPPVVIVLEFCHSSKELHTSGPFDEQVKARLKEISGPSCTILLNQIDSQQMQFIVGCGFQQPSGDDSGIAKSFGETKSESGAFVWLNVLTASGWQKWISIIFLWLIIGLSYFAIELAISYSGGHFSNSRWFLLTNLPWLLYICCSPLLIRICKRYQFQSGNLMWSIAVHLDVAVILWIVSVCAVAVFLRYVLESSNGLTQAFFSSLFYMRPTFYCFGYWSFVVFIQRLFYIGEYRNDSMEALRLKRSLIDAEMKALESQLHPHFLFNALHAISGLLSSNPSAALRMLNQLQVCLRVVLTDSESRQISLESELELIHSYILIQTTRFQDRLSVNIEMEPGTNSALIPRLLLQPIVENAIEHGIRKSNGPGEVKISAKRSKETLQLTVKDTGPGVNPFSTVERRAKGIGLSVTRQRLQQFYGTKHRFQTGNAREGGFFVKMEIPWQVDPPVVV